MAIEVTMPQMGADMTEGTVVRWLKQVGDEVKRGDVIAEIETDKATVELEAFDSGVVKKLVVDEGETVPVGEVIAIVGAADEQVGDDTPRKPPAETPARRTVDRGPDGTAPTPASAPAAAASAPVPVHNGARGRELEPGGGRLRISPVARRIATEAGLDATNLRGSGPDGRILRRDVEAALKGGVAAATGASPLASPAGPVDETAAAPAAAAAATAVPATSALQRAVQPERVVANGGTGTAEPLSRMRQAIARRMTLSKQTQPHYYLTLDVDMTAAMAFREQINTAASEEQRVSVNDLIVKACAIALQRHPRFNAAFADNAIRFNTQINIDIGIALDDGLIAPAIIDCGNRTLGSIAVAAKDVITRAKSGRLHPDEYSAGTFTITNLGGYGVETLIAIINPPQAAILGVGTVMPKPVVKDGEVVIRQVMKVALSADHRVTNGAEGAQFTKEIQRILENPASFAL